MEHDELLQKMRGLKACNEAMEWIASTPGTAAELWQKCERGDWMWWLLIRVRLPTKAQSVAYARWNAKRAKKYTAAADDAAAAAADAAAYADAAERKEQADYIRKHFECPM